MVLSYQKFLENSSNEYYEICPCEEGRVGKNRYHLDYKYWKDILDYDKLKFTDKELFKLAENEIHLAEKPNHRYFYFFKYKDLDNICVYKAPNDYYFAFTNEKSEDSSHGMLYRCDQIEGLIKLIKDKDVLKVNESVRYENKEISGEEYDHFIERGNFINFTDEQHDSLRKFMKKYGAFVSMKILSEEQPVRSNYMSKKSVLEFEMIEIYNEHDDRNDLIGILQMSDEWFLIMHENLDEIVQYKCDGFGGLLETIDMIMDSSCYAD